MDKRLIVALDYDNMPDVWQLVESLGDLVDFYKVGMELFYGAGVTAVKYLKSQGKDVFLDLKLHDIPNTVVKSAIVQTQLGVSLFNIHASGGKEMMTKTAKAVEETANKLGIYKPKLIAVTVLTSMNEEEWKNLNYSVSIKEQVVNLARLAKSSGLDGVVASPEEAESIRKECGDDFLIVTPGIRPQGAVLNDQSRVATPKSAIEAGANYLVIGRPITKASDPKEAALNILKEMGLEN